MQLDLHLHSTASDGTQSPASVVEAALRARLDVIALTDHDTTVGVEAAQAAARGHPLQVIPGIEVSSTSGVGDVHILGYFVDPAHPAIVEHARWAGARREERMHRMIEHLRAQGIEIRFEDVEAVAGADRGSLARPHLARALLAAGYVSSVAEAFDRYIGDDGPAYLPTRLLDPEGAVAIVLEGGGLPVWAHPDPLHVDALLPGLLRAGLRGIEALRPRHSPERTRLLSAAASSAGLFVTGGSDWHGPEGGELGRWRVEATEIGGFLEAAGM